MKTTGPSARRTLAAALRTAFVILIACRPGSAQTLPSPWLNADIGGPVISGAASHSSGVFTVEAAGADIWGSSDQFHFLYQQINGDVEVVARVEGITAQHAWSKAGVMIRATLAADSPHAYALVSAGKGVNFQRRAAAAALSTSTAASTATPPAWVRAVRSGTKVTTSWSTDGVTWTAIGSVTLPLGSAAYVGIAVTSHDASARTTATVSNVSVTSQALPPGQQNADIGAPAVAGSAGFSRGIYTVVAAGADIWDTADQFHFVYQPMTGDAELVARVVSFTNAHAWTKGGVMVRESLTAQSRHATVLTSVAKGHAFQRRPETGGLSVHTGGGVGAPPAWVRLVRTGDLFEAYHSSDGESWTAIGSDTIPMGATVYVGLAVTSHNTTTATTAVFDHVRISGPVISNAPPAVSVTSPASDARYTMPATVTIAAAATDPEGRMASVDFFADSTLISRETTAPYSASWSPPTPGTYSLTAVAHDADGGSTTSSAVSVTVLAPNAPPVVTLTGPPIAASFVAPAIIDLIATASDPEERLASVEFYVGSALISRATTAPYLATWSASSAGTYSLTAIAHDADGGSTTSSAVSVTVLPPNAPPVVTLTGPPIGASFVAPATIDLIATASDPEGRLASVEFYVGSALISRATTAPYLATWSASSAGTYSLTAIAHDADGGSTTSSAVSVTVLPPNAPPVVTLTGPPIGASFVAPATIDLIATASDPEGQLIRVELLNGTTVIGSVTTSPFSFTWSDVPAGSYTLQATAYDASGASGTSAAVTITVTPRLSPPRWVAFTASSDHSTSAVTNYLFDVFASDADPDTAVPIASLDLEKPEPETSNDITVDLAAFFSALAPGNYVATISAVGPGGRARSPAVAFTR